MKIHKSQIVLPKEKVVYLQTLFKVCPTTVWAALNFTKSNEIHRKIRRAAIENGGSFRVTVDVVDLKRAFPDTDIIITEL